jgi:hypothetical protein
MHTHKEIYVISEYNNFVTEATIHLFLYKQITLLKTSLGNMNVFEVQSSRTPVIAYVECLNCIFK